MRDEILKTLPAPEREVVLKLANEFELRDDDPAWLLAALAGNWKNWMQHETSDAALARESAIQHLRAQHKISIEQLQSATVAASRAADAQLQKTAAELTETLANKINYQVKHAIDQAAAGESLSDKLFRFIAPIVVGTGVFIVVVGFGLASGYVNPPMTSEQIDDWSWGRALAKNWGSIPTSIQRQIALTREQELAERNTK